MQVHSEQEYMWTEAMYPFKEGLGISPSPLSQKAHYQLYILWLPLTFRLMKLVGLRSLACRLRDSGSSKCFFILTLYF